MFAALRAELAIRFVEVAEFWRLIEQLERDSLASGVHEPALRTLKGLLFVHFYAVYENIVMASFAATVKQFNAHSFSFLDIKRLLLPIALHADFQSISDLSERRAWQPKLDLFEKSDSATLVSIPDTFFPRDDSHYRSHQLDTICATIGLPLGALVPAPRLIGWIQEVVTHRNAIAHGRDSAAAIGGRYSSGDLDDRRNLMEVLCNHIVSTLENYSASAASFHR